MTSTVVTLLILALAEMLMVIYAISFCASPSFNAKANVLMISIE